MILLHHPGVPFSHNHGSAENDSNLQLKQVFFGNSCPTFMIGGRIDRSWYNFKFFEIPWSPFRDTAIPKKRYQSKKEKKRERERERGRETA